MALDAKSLQEYPVDTGIPRGSILDSTFFWLPSWPICSIAVHADNVTLYSNCDQMSDLWQQLELAFEIGPDLWH